MNPVSAKPQEPRPKRRPSVETVLVIGGVALGILVLISLFISVAAQSDRGVGRTSSLAIVAAAIVPGLTVGGVFIAFWWLLRMLRRLDEALVRIEQEQRELCRQLAELRSRKSAGAEPGADTIIMGSNPASRGAGHDVPSMLAEIREICMMPEEERRVRSARLAEDQFARGLEQVTQLMADGSFAAASEQAQLWAAKRPDDPAAVELPAQVEAARRQREIRDVAAVTKEVNDFISMSAWAQARATAQQLQEQHPDSAEARQLMVRIEHEYGVAQDEQRRRMYAEVQRFVTRKRWEEALAAARTFIERFAGSDDSEALRLQIPTLELNAEIERRQQLEARIMDLARHGRYIEAAALARRVIDEYPDSPQAEALRRQIDRLDELATNPGAPPARIRLE
jgi:tetratricopeptide (TPR) repeat protein